MFDYLEAEWGDYIRRHATYVECVTGLDYRIAEEMVRESILRNQTPPDLSLHIIKAYRAYG